MRPEAEMVWLKIEPMVVIFVQSHSQCSFGAKKYDTKVIILYIYIYFTLLHRKTNYEITFLGNDLEIKMVIHLLRIIIRI